MDGWASLIGNVGIGGGLAFFFAWYLVRAVIPQLMSENERQREAFLAELAKQREEFLCALEGLKLSGERAASRISQRITDLGAQLSQLIPARWE